MIDCPGVVVDTAGDTEEDSVLKGVVRAERLESPQDFIDAICTKVKREYIAAQYKLPKDGPDSWSDSTELLEMIARRSGRLLKGGDPCLRSAAIMMINDFQRGRLPHYVAPPELKEDVVKPVVTEGMPAIKPQNLDELNRSDGNSKGPEEALEENANEEEDAKMSAGPVVAQGDWDD